MKEKSAMNLTKNKDVYMRGFGGRKGRLGMMSLY